MLRELRPEQALLQVGNAMEELVAWYDAQGDKGHVFRATQRCAAGIVEAIKHFKFDSSS
jgi:hypothetical protein